MMLKKRYLGAVLLGLCGAHACGMLYINTYKVDAERPEIFKKNIEMAIAAGKKIAFDSVETQAAALKKMKDFSGELDSYFLSKFAGAGGLIGFEWLKDVLKDVEKLPVAQRPAFEEKIKQVLVKIQSGVPVAVARKGLGALPGVPGGISGGGSGTGSGVPGGIPGGVPGGIGGEGEVLPPSEEGEDAPPPLDEPEEKKPAELVKKKPVGPQILTAVELAALSPQVQAKSDALLLEKLREISKMLDASKTWQAMFDQTMERLKDVRKNKDFYRREQFDKLFESIEKPRKDMKLVGPLADLFDTSFVKAQGVAVAVYLETLKNNFMQGMTAGIIKEFADLLRPCLFDQTKLAAVEEDLVRYCTTLVMLTRGQEPVLDKLSAVQKFRSDSAVVDLFQRFKARTGSFAGKTDKNLLKQFAREINLLRITPEFLRYQQLSEKGKGIFSINPLDLLCDAVYGAGEIKQSDLGIFVSVLFNPEENKQFLTGEHITQELVVAKAFDLKKAVEEIIKSKTISALSAQLPTLEKGLAPAPAPARATVVKNLIQMIRNNDDAQKIVDELKTIAGWVGLTVPDEARLVKQLNEARVSQQVKEGVKIAFTAARKKIVTRPNDEITLALYTGLAKAPGMNKEALKDVFASPDRTLDYLKEFFGRTLKIKSFDAGPLVQLNRNIKPLGIVLQALKALPNYKGKRSKLEMLGDLLETMLFPDQKLKYEQAEDPAFDPIIKNRDEISGGWVFKLEFEQLKQAVKSKDFNVLEKALNDFIESCGAWAQTPEEKQKWGETVVASKTIVKTALQAIAQGIPLAIVKELEKLSQGDSELDGKPIIPELILQDKGGYDRNKLIIKILDACTKDPINKILKDVVSLLRSNLTKIKTFDTLVLSGKFKELSYTLSATIKPTEFADPLRKQTLDGVEKYFKDVLMLLEQCKRYL